jgi:general secretion pathway protein I
MPADPPGRGQAGFTLLEVIVALAVVSLGIIAAFNLVVQIGTGSLHMKERTLGSWVAINEITRIRLSGEFPDVSEFDGDLEFAGREYRWRATVSETGVDDLRRIDMEVAYAETPDAVVATSVGFISPPPTPRLGGAVWSKSASAETPGGGSDEQADQTDTQGDQSQGSESDAREDAEDSR